jgi:CMP-N,N'-diacetyllegionaminic acid synthase
MNIVTLMMGRGGSSLTDKNIHPIKGAPLLQWAAQAAVGSRHISRFYMSSDSPAILAAAAQAGYKSIQRPPELATATALGCDVIRHAMPIMEADGPVDILVMQHANNATVTTQQIDDCIEMLMADPSLSSVVPAHRKPEYHPARGKFVNPDGCARSWRGSFRPTGRISSPACSSTTPSGCFGGAKRCSTPKARSPGPAWARASRRTKPTAASTCIRWKTSR